MIHINNMTVQYKGAKNLALDRVTLSLQRGECLLINGPTGCGKTTLLRSLAGLMHPEHVASFSGELTYSSDSQKDQKRQAPRVSILFQNPDDQIIGMTPREEILFSLEHANGDGAEVETIEKLSERAGISSYLDQDINTLSGGQKQRVITAAAVAAHPDLLLLDEPISNLDWKGREMLVNYLQQLKDSGMAMIICSHEIEELNDLATRRLFMQAGRIVEGEPEAVKWEKGETSGNHENSYTLLELEEVSQYKRDADFKFGPISLQVESGSIIGLLGANGSGKSTLLSLLASVLKPDSGNILLDDHSLQSYKTNSLYRKIAYVDQNSDLMIHRDTVAKELAARPHYLSLERFSDPEFTQLAAKTGLEKLLSHHPFSLSQGQRQRVAIAASIAGGLELLLVDEPTTGQDRRQISALVSLFEELKFQGVTVVFSTHNLNVATTFADKILFLDKGQLVFDGTAREFEKSKGEFFINSHENMS